MDVVEFCIQSRAGTRPCRGHGPILDPIVLDCNYNKSHNCDLLATFFAPEEAVHFTKENVEPRFVCGSAGLVTAGPLRVTNHA